MVESMFTFTLSATGFLIALTLQSLMSLVSSVFTLKFIVKPEVLLLGFSNWITRFKQTAPDSWDSSQFDPARWDHYALLVAFLGISSWGLWLSWSWNQEIRQAKGQARLAKESRKR